MARDITERQRAEQALLHKIDELNTAYRADWLLSSRSFWANYANLARQRKNSGRARRGHGNLPELLPQFVFEIDTAGRFLFVNQLATDVFGITREMLAAGVNMRDFIIPEEWEMIQRNMALILTGRKTSRDVYHCRRKDGILIPVNIFSAPVYGDGTLAGFRGIVVDITDAIRTQEALQKSETGIGNWPSSCPRSCLNWMNT